MGPHQRGHGAFPDPRCGVRPQRGLGSARHGQLRPMAELAMRHRRGSNEREGAHGASIGVAAEDLGGLWRRPAVVLEGARAQAGGHGGDADASDAVPAGVSAETPAQPAARRACGRSTRRVACRSTPEPPAADGEASVWTTTSLSMVCAGRRAILDGPNKGARTTIRIDSLTANQVSVKKYLPMFAVLALAGCAHSGFRATYLHE